VSGSGDGSKDEHVAAFVVVDAVTFEFRRNVFMWSGTPAKERAAFYRSLLKISWLPPKVRRAIMSELGLSLRVQNREVEEAVSMALLQLIANEKVRLKENGERPQGGISDAAVAEIAHTQSMTVEAMKKRLQRHRKRRKK
jgi:hypothetical protein